MNELEKEIALLERLLENQLTAEEKLEVEERIENEPEFNNLFKQVKLLINGIKYAERNSVKAKLVELEQSLPEVELDLAESAETDMEKAETKTVLFRQPRFWMGIAAALLLALVARFAIFTQSGVSPENLYASHYKAYPNVISATTRGVSEDNLDDLEMAMKYYDQENYQAAIDVLEKLASQDFDSSVHLYLGIAYMETGDNEKAIKNFNEGLKLPGNFDHQLNWYLGLTYLKTGKLDKAKPIFENLKDSKYTKSEEAGKILEELKK